MFTLAGALFFGWSEKFYELEYYSYMQPLLLALATVHLAMPLLENKFTRSTRFVRFDIAYFALLPLVAAALTLKIAPNVHAEGAIGLGTLALIWGVAAGILFTRTHPESARHAMVAAMLATAAALSYFEDIPWLLVELGLSVATLVVASRQDGFRKTEEFACGAGTVLGVLHIVQSITLPQPPQAFLSKMFAHRLLAGALMIIGAITGSRREISFAKILGVIGFGWVTLAFVAEIDRLNIDYLPQLGYGIILGALTLQVLLGDKIPATSTVGGVLIFSLIGLGWWAAPHASSYVAIAYMAITPAVLLGLTWSGHSAVQKDGSDFASTIAMGLLPFALMPWAFFTTDLAGANTDFYEITIVMAGIAAAGLAGRHWLDASARWNGRVQPLHVYFTAAALLWATLFHIERGIWPVAFDMLALGYLIAYVSRRGRKQASVSPAIAVATVLSVALVLQAMLLRGFGPDDLVMTAADINKMHLPAVVSLMWVIVGSGLAWWGTSTKDRALWSFGAGLLVVAAIKLVLFDFGALGQLGNILAFIAAGMAFMGVAWFAPIPPKAERTPKPVAIPQPIPPTAADISSQQPSAERQISGQRFDPATRPTGDRSADGSQPKPRIHREAEHPEDSGGRWLLIFGLAIVIALFFSFQHKRNRLHMAQEQTVRAAEAQRAAREQPATAQSDSVAYASSSASAQAMPQGTSSVSDDPPTQPAERLDPCLQFAGKLPPDFAVYAAGAYGGKTIAFQIDQSGHTGTQIDIEVNQPDKPIVLILGAYEPTIWNISLSPETQVLAVLVSGYHRQVIAGLSQSIPSLISTYDNRGPCGYFYVSQDSLAGLNPLARRIFGRPADMVYPATDGRVVIGAAMPGNARSSASSGPSPESFRDESAPLAGEAGLEEAVRKGLLRKATAADAEAWVDAVIQNTPHRDIPSVAGQGIPRPSKPAMYNAYVVLAEFTYPAGLFGAHSATFLIPKGVPRPKGNPGHSAVYDFNTLGCQGALCTSR